MANEEYYKLSDVAELLDINKDWLRKLVHIKNGPFKYMMNSKKKGLWISESSVEKYIRLDIQNHIQKQRRDSKYINILVCELKKPDSMFWQLALRILLDFLNEQLEEYKKYVDKIKNLEMQHNELEELNKNMNKNLQYDSIVKEMSPQLRAEYEQLMIVRKREEQCKAHEKIIEDLVKEYGSKKSDL